MSRKQVLIPLGVAVVAFTIVLAVAAAMFDASENVALLLTLAGHGGSLPAVATVCSSIKFTLIGVAILYVICGLALRFRARLLQPT